MAATGRVVQALVTQVSELTTQLQLLKTESIFTKPCLPPPAFYSVESQQCNPFLAKCSLYISLQPSFPTEDVRGY